MSSKKCFDLRGVIFGIHFILFNIEAQFRSKADNVLPSHTKTQKEKFRASKYFSGQLDKKYGVEENKKNSEGSFYGQSIPLTRIIIIVHL